MTTEEKIKFYRKVLKMVSSSANIEAAKMKIQAELFVLQVRG